MCGIVGYVGPRDAVSILIDGLSRLEYRGYDSAGIALIDDGHMVVHKQKGKISELVDLLPADLHGSIGIGHTRWATHGEPNQINAHPHLDPTGRIAVVHNGIIENASVIREKLINDGAILRSDTDTELLAHLIARSESDNLADAVRQALSVIEGAYGLAVLDTANPGTIVVARNGSPVVIGIGEHENFVASDVGAIIRHTQQVVYLDDGEIAVVEADGFRILDANLAERDKPLEFINWNIDSFDKGDHEHFLRKEILEQPEALARTLSGRVDARFATAHLGGVQLSAQEVLRIRRVVLFGCGSTYYSALAGAQLIERLARIPAEAEPASEFRYRNPIIQPDTLYIGISQSGETLDTLRAVQEVRRKGGTVIGIVNVVGSSIARECGSGIYLHAGPEVSVASTKTFNCTVAACALLALHLGRIRDLSVIDGSRIISALEALPDLISATLGCEPQAKVIAEAYAEMTDCFFIGRVWGHPIALEGSQKLKEVSYVHAEAYPASELKHGPLALITPQLPTFAICPRDALFDKNISTIREIQSRGGPVIAIGHDPELAEVAEHAIIVPKSEPELDPILLTIPLQLIAYHSALIRGVDIDQPRNLAKSVTVE